MEASDLDEQTIRAACEAGNADEAATRVLEAHGPQVMRFLLRRTDDQQLASDAFAQFAEDVWLGLPRFEYRCALRSWVFTLAHHALMRLAKMQGRERKHLVHASSSASQVAHRVRSETLPYLRSEVRDGVARLREQLPDDDRLLLELRVGQRFSWKDIARITLGASNDAATLEREAARLRKRFELVKRQLRSWAERDGLVLDENT